MYILVTTIREVGEMEMGNGDVVIYIEPNKKKGTSTIQDFFGPISCLTTLGEVGEMEINQGKNLFVLH